MIQPIAMESFGGVNISGSGEVLSHRDAGAFLDDEDKEAEEMRRREEEKKKQNESPYKEFYREGKGQGNYYDPAKKFGII